MLKYFFKNSFYLLYAESPFQLLQVYEILKTKNIKNYKILIRLNHIAINNQQLIKLVRVLNLINVNYIRTPFENKINFIFLLIKFFFTIINYKKIYLAEDGGVFKCLKFLFKNKKFILIDDGMSTLHTKLKPNLYERFSIFNIPSNTNLNTFVFIKKLALKNKTKKKTNIIIGTNYCEENIIKQEIYFNYLRTIKSKKNKSEDLIYIPHRAESKKKLNKIQNEIEINILKTELPIELINYELGIAPLTLYGTSSTALFSMKLIYENAEFISYKFKEKHLHSRKDKVLKFYKIIDNYNFINKVLLD